jgi:hypothetical protein
LGMEGQRERNLERRNGAGGGDVHGDRTMERHFGRLLHSVDRTRKSSVSRTYILSVVADGSGT